MKRYHVYYNRTDKIKKDILDVYANNIQEAITKFLDVTTDHLIPVDTITKVEETKEN